MAQNSIVRTTASNPTFKLFFEKTWLHTDRDVYAQGDTLWYKAYLVNGQDNILAKTSSTLYVDLIDTGTHIIRTEIIHLTDGLGNGDFELPDNFAPGQYRLRAYTNWIRNFGDNFVFEKTVTVLGSSSEVAVTGKKVSETGKNKTASIATNLPAPPHLAIVNFFPEGGSLIEGVNAIVAVKAETDRPVLGTVVSSAGDTVARFTCDSLGMGIFALLPLKGQLYKAVVKGHTYPLPAALVKGLSLQVRNTDSLLRLVISRSDTSFKSAMLTVKHAGILVLNQQIELYAAQVAVKISVAGLPEGINAITLYDDQNHPQCERLVYIHHKQLWHTTLITDKPTYQPFEKTTLNIDAGQAAHLSVAVVDAAMVPVQADDITSYLMLQSEIKGNIEQPKRYFDTTNINRAKQLDLLLLTQGWRDFIWRRIADTAIRLSYIAEYGITVAGKVEDEVNHKAMQGLNVSLYADAAKGDKILSTNTDAAGRFNISNLMLYGKQNVKLASINNKGKKQGSFLVDTLVPMPVKQPILLPTKNFLLEVAITAKQKINLKNGTRLKEVLIKDKKVQATRVSGTAVMPWGPHPDQLFIIKPEDMEYKTLAWFIIQNVIGAHAMPNGGVFMPVVGKSRRLFFFVNGKELPSNDNLNPYYRNLYFNMSLNKFKTIEVKTTVGPDQWNGGIVDYCLLYLTTINDYMTDNSGSLSTDIPGYYEARTFYKPVYAEGNPPKADLRTTIHWEPELTTDRSGHAQLSYYNTGNIGPVRVLVQGITAYGLPISKTISYTVK